MSRAAVFSLVLATSLAAHALPRPPTPRERIERALRPVTDAMRDVAPTPDERATLERWLSSAEAIAASRVDAERHGERARVAVLDHELETLAHIIREQVALARFEAAIAAREASRRDR